MRPTGTMHAAGAVLVAVLASLAPACSTQSSAATGELVVVVNTDMAVPQDIDAVHFELEATTSLQVDTVAGDAGAPKFPQTLGILSDGTHQAITVRVVAMRAGRPRVLREITTTVPTTRKAMVRVPLQWVCDGSATVADGGAIAGVCGTGATCIAGECVDEGVDSANLPDYDPTLVFGGASGPGGGACFDTLMCFEGHAQALTPDASCSVIVPDTPQNVNLALELPPGSDGICGTTGCYMPLDTGVATGWRKNDAAGSVALPRGVCDAMKRTPQIQVVVSTACPSKTENVPTCGPWSATGGGSIPAAPGGNVPQ